MVVYKNNTIQIPLTVYEVTGVSEECKSALLGNYLNIFKPGKRVKLNTEIDPDLTTDQIIISPCKILNEDNLAFVYPIVKASLIFPNSPYLDKEDKDVFAHIIKIDNIDELITFELVLCDRKQNTFMIVSFCQIKR